MNKRIAHRIVHRIAPAAALLLLTAAPLGAQCRAGGELLAAAPSVTLLRAYRPSLAAPARLAVDGAGAVYIADPAAGRITVRAVDGRIVRVLEEPDAPVSIAVDVAGNILVGEGRRGRVDVYAPDGRRVRSLGRGDGEVSYPADIGVHTRSGEIFVADNRAHVVKRYSAAGTLLQTIGGKGTAPGQLDVPSALFIDAQRDELLVADQRNGRIQVLRTNGEPVYCIAAAVLTRCGGVLMPCGQLRQADQGLWSDAKGRIYVADGFDGRVLVIDRNGNLLSTIGAFGSGPGQLDGPSDIVIDSQNRLFVSSSNNGRIEMFGLDGHADSEMYAPARVSFSPGSLDPSTAVAIIARVEAVGYRMDGVSASSFIANDIAPAQSAAVANDSDGNGVDELVLTFGPDLIRTLPASGTAEIVVRGPAGTLRFEAAGAVTIETTAPATRCPCDAPWKDHGAYVACVVQEAQDLYLQGRITEKEMAERTSAAAASSCGRT